RGRSSQCLRRRRAPVAGGGRRAGDAAVLQRVHAPVTLRDASGRARARRSRNSRRRVAGPSLSRRRRAREWPGRRGDGDGHNGGYRSLRRGARGGAGMTVNPSGWRPEMGGAGESAPATYTGNRGLMLEEPLIFEIGGAETTGVDIPAPSASGSRLGGLDRESGIGLPGLSEPEAIRHYTRLSRQNYAIDLGLFPLGSCTMKHNPRLNEKVARLPGFADLHPLAPIDTVQGAL